MLKSDINETNDKETKQKNPIREAANKLGKAKQINNAYNIVINGIDTHIPINLPIAIIGEKGSGKTTLIRSIIETTNKKIYNNIYFIYSSLTSDLVLPTNITKIDVNDCETFLSILFEAKSIFNSYCRFFKSLDFKRLQALYDNGKLKDEDILKYVDNNIMKYNKVMLKTINDPHVKIDKIISTGEKIIKKFSNKFYIDNYQIDGLKYNARDAVIIDDIAIASKILFRSVKDNPIYEYLTLTRHMRLMVCFAGQQIEQVPKSIRREIMCWIVSKNTNLELLKGILSKDVLRDIIEKQKEIDKYEFVVFNMIDGETNKI